jgi:CheY-like chemotaxis protein
MERLIRVTFPKNIQLQINCPKDLRTIAGDGTQLHQVLLNLCVNARDAMPDGGTLTLNAENTELDSVYASAVPEAKPGHYVVWRVMDTGTGIPADIVDRIFEPFFSTKGPDKGTGLGLSTVVGIVKGHGGFVRVYSAPGQGSTFAVYLPAAGAGTGDTALLPKGDTTFRGNGETILVVDDEAAVRDVTRGVLTGLNFKVVTVANGTDALIQVAERQAELRAVITDLHMPRMNGLDFVRLLKAKLPNAGIIVASGRLEEREEEEFKAMGVRALLEKPFTQEKLVGALKTVFERPQNFGVVTPYTSEPTNIRIDQ